MGYKACQYIPKIGIHKYYTKIFVDSSLGPAKKPLTFMPSQEMDLQIPLPAFRGPSLTIPDLHH
jgi:hypothetical protein